MTTEPILSILTPTIPGRRDQLAELQRHIHDTTKPSLKGRVQHLCLCDNRLMSIGQKRQALVQAASGRYVAFVDDDDWIAPEYVWEVCWAANYEDPTADGERLDVITFEQDAVYNGMRSHVVFRHGQSNTPFQPGGKTLRAAWHVCAWRRELAQRFAFPDSNYGEDWAWAQQLNNVAKTSLHIPKILHYYRHDATTTAAPEPTMTNDMEKTQ